MVPWSAVLTPKNARGRPVTKLCLALETFRRTDEGRVRDAKTFLTHYFPQNGGSAVDRLFLHIPNEVRADLLSNWGIRGKKSALRDDDEKVRRTIDDALGAGDIDASVIEDGVTPEILMDWAPLEDWWSFWRGRALPLTAIRKALAVARDLMLFDERWFLQNLALPSQRLTGTEVVCAALSKEQVAQWVASVHESGDASPAGLIKAVGWDVILTKTAHDALLFALDALAARTGLASPAASAAPPDPTPAPRELAKPVALAPPSEPTRPDVPPPDTTARDVTAAKTSDPNVASKGSGPSLAAASDSDVAAKTEAAAKAPPARGSDPSHGVKADAPAAASSEAAIPAARGSEPSQGARPSAATAAPEARASQPRIEVAQVVGSPGGPPSGKPPVPGQASKPPGKPPPLPGMRASSPSMPAVVAKPTASAHEEAPPTSGPPSARVLFGAPDPTPSNAPPVRAKAPTLAGVGPEGYAIPPFGEPSSDAPPPPSEEGAAAGPLEEPAWAPPRAEPGDMGWDIVYGVKRQMGTNVQPKYNFDDDDEPTSEIAVPDGPRR